MQTTKPTHSLLHSFEWNYGCSSSSEVADFIGVESCVDLKDAEDVLITTGASIGGGDGGKRRCETRKPAEKKEYPPPMPMQAWDMKRYYTTDGRLIIKEERANHEYFRAHRSDGRLTLQLVPVIDQYDDDYDEEDEEEDGDENVSALTQSLKEVHNTDLLTQEEVDNTDNNDENNNNDDDDDDDNYNDGGDIEGGGTGKDEEEEVHDDGVHNVVDDGGKVGWNRYNDARMSPCMYPMPVPSISTVHI